MLIGQFVDTYPPCVDGVGRVTQSYCETLTAMGHQAWYIAPDAPGTAGNFDFPVLLQKSIAIPGEPFRLGIPAVDFSYRKRLDEIPFDIVHAQSPFSAGEEAQRIARKRGIPLVTTFHSKYYQDFYDKTKSRVIAKSVVAKIVRFYNYCDGVWRVNHATAEVLREYGYHGKILIMENGTNLEPLSPSGEAALQKRVTLDERPVLLFRFDQSGGKIAARLLLLLIRRGLRQIDVPACRPLLQNLLPHCHEFPFRDLSVLNFHQLISSFMIWSAISGSLCASRPIAARI